MSVTAGPLLSSTWFAPVLVVEPVALVESDALVEPIEEPGLELIPLPPPGAGRSLVPFAAGVSIFVCWAMADPVTDQTIRTVRVIEMLRIAYSFSASRRINSALCQRSSIKVFEHPGLRPIPEKGGGAGIRFRERKA